MRTIKTALLLATMTQFTMTQAMAGDPPRYKPGSRAEPIDISTNAYGASQFAPSALGIGETAPDFSLPISGGGNLLLSDLAADSPVALIFYRGHW